MLATGVRGRRLASRIGQHVKKLKTTRKVRIRVARKRHLRALKSKAGRAHRRGTGHKDTEQE